VSFRDSMAERFTIGDRFFFPDEEAARAFDELFPG
jgi:hypothetical protein